MQDYHSSYICSGVNTVAKAISWIGNENSKGKGFVASVCSNLVTLTSNPDQDHANVIQTLHNSNGSSNEDEKLLCLATLQFNSPSQQSLAAILTGSSAGTLQMWLLNQNRNSNSEGSIDECLRYAVQLRSKLAVQCLAAISVNNKFIAIASDTKGNVSVYLSSNISQLDLAENNVTLELIQELSFQPQQMPNTIHLLALSPTNLLLCVGAVDSKIYFYTASVNLNYSVSAFACVGQLWGHEEWITCFDSRTIASSADNNAILLASGSQDNKIRIWKIVPSSDNASPAAVSSAAATAAVTTEEDDEDDTDESKAQSAITSTAEDEKSEARLAFTHDDRVYLVYLEALLVGHEDWVTSVHWLPTTEEQEEQPALFSTSMDRNMVIWQADRVLSGGVWTPIVRVGDVGGALGGSVGGNLLGFVSGCVSPDGRSIMGVGYGGSVHHWTMLSSTAELSLSLRESRWRPVPFPSGHFDAVTSLAWASWSSLSSSSSVEDEKYYMLSSSRDETIRLHAPIPRLSNIWREISRPLIHGYAVNCVQSLSTSASPSIIAASDEKIIRILDMPRIVWNGLTTLCEMPTSSADMPRTEQAYIPELSLTNKARENMNTQEMKEQEVRGVSAIDWQRAPLESQLADLTIWPETRKLYGHHNDVVCMTMSKDGHYFATACKSRFANLPTGSSSSSGTAPTSKNLGSPIFVWETRSGNYHIISRLEGHEGTVVSLEFSPDGKYLSSMGKDRSICIHTLIDGDQQQYESILCVKNAHKRIIWTCSWAPDSKTFVSGSRDGALKLWQLKFPLISDTSVEATTSLPTSLANLVTITPFANSAAVTAMEFHPRLWLLLVGSGDGDMHIFTIDSTTLQLNVAWKVSPDFAHAKSVSCLQWRPTDLASVVAGSDNLRLCWASASEDHTVRIHEISYSPSS